MKATTEMHIQKFEAYITHTKHSWYDIWFKTVVPQSSFLFMLGMMESDGEEHNKMK